MSVKPLHKYSLVDCKQIIIAFDPYFPNKESTWDTIPRKRFKTVPEILEVADVVTLHVPVTRSTKNMIAAPKLKQMKKTAILINTARGGIVNEEDLADALEKGEICGAGFDCHCEEPPTLAKRHKLLRSVWL